MKADGSLKSWVARGGTNLMLSFDPLDWFSMLEIISEIYSKMSLFGCSVSIAQPALFQGDVRCGVSRSRCV